MTRTTDEHKASVLIVRMSERQKTALRATATAAGLSMSAFVRQAAERAVLAALKPAGGAR